MITKSQYKKVKLARKMLKAIKIKDPTMEKERQKKLKECEEFIRRYENGERE
ncbi:MAG: hypothetical protein II393_02120 [Cytophagales bacterium]|nr:hypothetical protein [Cytophagales bacterium]